MSAYIHAERERKRDITRWHAAWSKGESGSQPVVVLLQTNIKTELLRYSRRGCEEEDGDMSSASYS